MYGTLRLFPVFISPIVWNMYGICVNIFNMNRYISKSYTRSKNTIFRAGAAVVSTITSLQYIGETKRNLKDRFNEHRRPILNPTGNYIHTAVSEHFLTSNHSDNHMLLIPIEKLKMGVILSGKQAKPTLSTKLRQLSLWALINVMNCNYIQYIFYFLLSCLFKVATPYHIIL